MRYAWINQHTDFWPVRTMCRVLNVSSSGYYHWLNNPPSKQVQKRERLAELVLKSHNESFSVYGYRKVHQDLVEWGEEVCCDETVRQVMKDLGIQSIRTKKKVRTTDSSHSLPVALNIIKRNFSATKRNEKWLADITYIRVRDIWVYLAVVLDCFSRKIVGWAMSRNIDSDLVCKALQQALVTRNPETELIHHSDRGSQYASKQFVKMIETNGITLSMSRKGDPWDNAMMESFFGSLKNEWVRRPYASIAEAELEVFKYIEMFYNPIRRHENLDGISPVEFERKWST